MESIELRLAKLFQECKRSAQKSINTCFHPNCELNSINSHILQKNGILSSIATSNHLWELSINKFSQPEFEFKRTGINKVYSFKCFCSKHDTDLFSKIENHNIDFGDYESFLLLTLRNIYFETFKKTVGVKTFECVKEKDPMLFKPGFIDQLKYKEELGLSDLIQIEQDIWNDLNNGTESYIFNSRTFEKLELCLSSIYTYDTSEEMRNYELMYGKPMPRLSEIFINFFPYNNQSVLLMGYHKRDENKVKGYFNAFFKEKERNVQRKLTNLFLFLCETWVASDNFYEEKIKGVETIFADAINYSQQNTNERKTFDLNVFTNDFKEKFQYWKKKNVG